MIADTRLAVYAHLLAWPALDGVPVLGELPDDVAELPVVVVGRPSLGPSAEGFLIDAMSTPVWSVGRRVNDAGAQVELDELADIVLLASFARIDGLPGGVAAEVRADPQTVMVAGQEYPCYLVTLDTVAPRPCGD